MSKWIPCAERMPEEDGVYIVTDILGDSPRVDWNVFVNGKWLHCIKNHIACIAWMPLPEPYVDSEE